MEIKERIAALRGVMARAGVDLYVVPTSDFHSSEYVGAHFKDRTFITGFTGSAGTAVIGAEEACLWADGRYHIQAAAQIEGTGIVLQKMGTKDVPTVEEYLEKALPEGGVIGFDGRCVTMQEAEAYAGIAAKKNGSVRMDANLIDAVWTDRPALPQTALWILEERYAGKTAAEKLADVREQMEAHEADAHLLTSLYDIAWLLNLRADDIPNVPVFLSYVLLTKTSAAIYVCEDAVSDEVRAYLADAGVSVRPYEAVYEDLAALSPDQVSAILLDPNIVNARLDATIDAGIRRVEEPNPTERMKAQKNAVEIKNTIEAHIHDGVAVTKFIYWLKNAIGREEITEISASDVLEELRRQQPGFLDLSFGTISAYGANAAMMHYSATPEHNAVLKPEGFLLVDSGGHYLTGTTDITRTIALGPLTEKMREYYTIVLRCHLRLLAAHFMEGCTGANLDILARGPVWDRGLDYRCGTGHGVGHILNVHEGPNSMRWKIADRGRAWPLAPGMITTNEPGLYIEGEFGIRIENEMLCVEAEETEYGTFLRHESLTVAPIDLDPVIPEMLTAEEKNTLNAYHAYVRETLSPYLTDEEKTWLLEETRALS